MESMKSYYDTYVYPGYGFERPIYLYIWEILVILTSLFNVVVIIVLMHRTVRNTTNLILTAIAISDSMTGLVTLPSYIAVYHQFTPASPFNYHSIHPSNVSNISSNTASGEFSFTGYVYDEDFYTGDSIDYGEPQEGYTLHEHLCRYFMISKFFVSQTFHTISIWLTLILGVHRFASVASPLKSLAWFSTRKTVIICVTIAICSPILHSYHLFHDKATQGWCEWKLEDNDKAGISYIWIRFLFVHFIPCVSLVIVTGMFLIKLWKGSSGRQNISSCHDSVVQMRTDDNRRISIVVIVIVIVFLIPELPYGGFLLYLAILRATNQGFPPLETNRAIHATYEIVLVVSFHANFYIYTLLNRKFRSTLKTLILTPIRQLLTRKQQHTRSNQILSENSHDKDTSVTMAAELKPVDQEYPQTACMKPAVIETRLDDV